mgnify:CR=1 FL=1
MLVFEYGDFVYRPCTAPVTRMKSYKSTGGRCGEESPSCGNAIGWPPSRR